jgi:hypothetical protein
VLEMLRDTFAIWWRLHVRHAYGTRWRGRASARRGYGPQGGTCGS